MNRLVVLTLLFVSLSTGWSSAHAETASEVQELHWNVYLKNWQVLGPLPKPDQSASGLDVKFVENEANLRAGDAFFYDSRLYVWQSTDYHAIPIRNAFRTFGQEGYNAVAYAFTEIHSPVEQKAVLSVGYDDHFRAWLNGEPVGSGEDNSSAIIDQSLHEVTLRQGTNSLLIKVGQNVRGWEVLARLLPPGLDEPLLVVRAENSPNPSKLPPIRVEFLDRQQQVQAVHYTSGGRPGSRVGGSGAYYPLYAPLPSPQPTFVRYVVEGDGYAPTPQTVPWQQARSKETRLRMLSDRPLELVVVDGKSGEPLKNAEVWMKDKRLATDSDASGKITLPDLDPIDHQCWIVARGYAVERVALKWPRTAQRVELQPGGKSLKGRVLDPSGKPVPGVRITSNVSDAYSPTTVSDENGEYELYGFPESLSSLRPQFKARGYIPFPYTQVALPGNETTYDAILQPGATIQGVVTHQTTGQPLANVKLNVGEDRFGSTNSIEATTDAQGRYTLFGVPVGGCVIHAISPQHAPSVKTTVARAGTATSLDFQLLEGTPVTGRVVDHEGKPLSNVWLVTDTWNEYRVFNRETRTNANGEFTLPHMPSSPAEVDILKQGYISIRNHVFRGGDSSMIQMKPQVDYTFRITDASNGGVIPGLSISIGRLWSGNPQYHWSTSEWETSRYYNSSTGIFTVTIDEPEQAQIAYRFRASGYQEKEFQLPAEHKASQEFEIELEKAEVFAGRVVEAESQRPVVGAKVCLITPSDRFRADHYVNYRSAWQYLGDGQYSGVVQTTDSRGDFHLTPPVHPETALLITRQDGSFHFVPRFKTLVEAHQQSQEPLQVPMPKAASLSGQVLIGDEPVIGGEVKVHWEYPASFPNDLREMFGVGGQVKTDSEGRFHFPALGAGRYAVRRVFTHQMGRYSTSQYLDSTHVELTAGRNAEVTLNRPPGVNVRGRAVTNGGEPLHRCLITVAAGNDRYTTVEMAHTDENGEFEVPHLAPGRYRFQATHYAPGSSMSADFTGIAIVDVESTSNDPVLITMNAAVRSEPQREPVRELLAGTLPHAVELPGTETQAASRLSDYQGKVVVFYSASRWTFSSKEVLEKLKELGELPDVHLVTLYSGTLEDFETVTGQSDIEIPGRVVCSDGEGGHPVLSHLPLGLNHAVVIGSDGKLATEIIPLTSFDVSAIATIKTEPDQTSTSRLTIKIDVPDGQMGPLNSELSLQAINAEGTQVDAAEYRMNGETREVDWNFLTPGVTKIQATFAAPGIERQEQELSMLAAENEITFRASAPNRITGSIDSAQVSRSLEGMQVRLYGWTPQGQLPLTTDARVNKVGEFAIPCYPGSYYFSFVPLNELVISEGAQSVTVAEGSDPEPQLLTAVPAVDVVVQVSLDDGTPAVGAHVTGSQGVEARTDAAGRATISSVRTDGISELWAWYDQEYGSTTIDQPTAGEVFEIVIGQRPGQAVSSTEPKGRILPVVAVTKSDGEQIEWPGEQRSRIVVIGDLWRLDTRQLIDRAMKRAAEQGIGLEILSTDRSPSVISEWSERLAGKNAVIYVLNASHLEVGAQWILYPEARAFIVDEENRISEQLSKGNQPVGSP